MSSSSVSAFFHCKHIINKLLYIDIYITANKVGLAWSKTISDISTRRHTHTKKEDRIIAKSPRRQPQCTRECVTVSFSSGLFCITQQCKMSHCGGWATPLKYFNRRHTTCCERKMSSRMLHVKMHLVTSRQSNMNTCVISTRTHTHTQ